MSCVRANLPERLRIGQFVLRNDAGTPAESRLLGEAYYRGPDSDDTSSSAMLKLRLDRPAAYAGSAYLVRDMEEARRGVFIFLPSIGAVRRVAPGLNEGQLFGSEFDYQDLRLLHSVLGDITLRDLGEENSRGRRIQRYGVELEPVSAEIEQSAEVWLDMQTCLPHKVMIYRNDAPHKEIILPIENVRPLGGGWIPTEIVARNLRTERRSVITLSQLDPKSAIDERHWHPHRFFEARH